jgi:cyclophilin family peptidyl-prolyl cis-trans isomerase
MHDLLYERQQEWSRPETTEEQMIDQLVEYADELGLDVDRFEDELRAHVYRAKVEADTQGATEISLPGTPSYIVNGVMYPMQDLHLAPAPIKAFIDLALLDQYADVPPKVIDAGNEYVATIRTSKGDIVVELFADQAPVNVNNFAFLAQEGWYDGQTFFYVEPENGAYSGDPTGMGWTLPFPGYRCGLEIGPDLTFDEAGMVAYFADSSGSNSSLFFITNAPRPQSNGQFTIIGRVIEGMDVVADLAVVTPGTGAVPDSIGTITIEER